MITIIFAAFTQTQITHDDTNIYMIGAYLHIPQVHDIAYADWASVTDSNRKLRESSSNLSVSSPLRRRLEGDATDICLNAFGLKRIYKVLRVFI